MTRPFHVEPTEALITTLLDGASKDMNVNGSVTPVDFKYTCPSAKKIYVERLTMFLADATAFTQTNFGDVAGPLTNGVDLIVGGNTIYNMKDNVDLDLLACSFEGHAIFEKDTTAGSMRLSFPTCLGAPILLTAGEEFIIRVNDDLTTLTHFHAVIAGLLFTDNQVA